MKKAASRRLRLPLFIAIAALLVACGGGSGSDPTSLVCLALPEGESVRTDQGGSAWNDVLVDRAGQLWLAGYDGAKSGMGVEPLGDTRAVLWHLDHKGMLRWHSQDVFQTAGTDAFEALVQGETGLVHAVGRTTGAMAGHANAGKADVFVAWGDTGAPPAAWLISQFGNERPQHPKRAAFHRSGALAIAGYDDEYVPTNYVESWSDPFAMAVVAGRGVDGKGEVRSLWQHQFRTPEPDLVDGLAVTADGAATFVSGQSGGEAKGMFVRRLDSTGNAVWTARYSSVPLDHIAAIVPAGDGSLWIGGSVYGSFRGATSQGQQDVFIARIDAADGHVLAAWQFGTAQSDWLADLRIDRQGNLVLLGETLGAFPGAMNPDGGSDLFMLRVAPDGRVLGSRQWGAPGDEVASRLALDACGNAVAVGSTIRNGFRRALLWIWRPTAA